MLTTGSSSAPNPYRYTLHSAVKADLPDVCEILLNNRANLTIQDLNGLTPFHNALHYQRKRCAELIFQRMDEKSRICADYLIQQRLFINRFHASFSIKPFIFRNKITIGFAEVSYKEIQESFAVYMSKALKPTEPIFKILSNNVIWPHSKASIEQFLKKPNDQIFIVSTCWYTPAYGHEVTTIITNKHLYLCDRGVRQERGITIYEIVDHKELIKVLPILEASNEETHQFITFEIDTFPYLKKIKFIEQRSQRVGNCTWLSPKGIPFALFIAATVKSDEIPDDIISLAKKHYKEWSELDRVYGTLKYFTHPYHHEANKNPGIPTFERCLIESQLNLGEKSRRKWARHLRKLSDCSGIDHQISQLKWNVLEGDFKEFLEENKTFEMGEYSLVHFTAMHGEGELAQKLVQNGSRSVVKNKMIPTPTHLALHLKIYNIVKFLHEPRSHLDIKDNKKKTLFFLACEHNQTELALDLILKGVDLFINCSEKRSPLMFVALHGNIIIAEKILSDRNIIDHINEQDGDGHTALHYAAIRGNLKICELLYRSGANLKIPSNDGQTPLLKAAKNGFSDVFSWFLTHLNDEDLKHADKLGMTSFHLAAKSNCQDICQQLINRGISPVVSDLSGNTPFLIAIQYNHSELAKWLLQEINSRNLESPNLSIESLSSPLVSAIDNMNIEMAMMLIPKLSVVDLDYADAIYKVTALHIAAVRNQREVCELLVDKGAAMMALTCQGNTPLMLTLLSDHVELAEWFIDKLTLEDLCHANYEGITALHIATSKNQESICKLLVKRGVNLKSKTSNGNIPLFSAMNFSYWNLAKWMIEESDAETLNMVINGNTAFHIAARYNQVDICRLLKERGANPMALNNFKYHPLLCALWGNREKEVSIWFVDILDTKDLEQTDSDGYNALHSAVATNHRNIIERLLQRGMSPQAVTNSGQSILYLAIDYGYIELAEWLIERLDLETLNRGDNMGVTPFLNAAWNGQLNICKLLMEKQIDSRGTTVDKKNTALHMALYRGHFDVAEWLISIFDKEQLNQANHAGVTPLHIAAIWNQEKLCKLLIERGANPEPVTNRGNTPRSLALNNGHLELANILKPSDDTLETHQVMCRKLSSLNTFDSSPLLLALMQGYSSIGESYVSKIEDEELIRMKLTGKMPWFVILIEKSQKFSEMLLSREHIFNYFENSSVLMLTRSAIERSHKCVLEIILKEKGESFFPEDLLSKIKSIVI